MKKANLYGAMAFGLLLTACSSDPMNEPTNKPLDTDQTFYVNMTIHGDAASTRTGQDNGSPVDGNTDFEAGTGTESKINNAYFVFYDKDGLVVGDIVPVEMTNEMATAGTDGTTVETVYKSVVGVSVRKGENPPTGVICYINPVSPSSLQTTLSQIQTVTRDRVTTNINNETIFPMSNSVYYHGPNSDTADPTVSTLPQIMVPISTGQLFKTEQDALNSTEAENVVNVYVERYATKLKFTAVADANNKDYETRSRVFTVGTDNNVTTSDKTVILHFTPQKWALNAEAKDSYVVKSFRRESAEGQILADNYSYGLLNYRINPSDPLNVQISDVAGTVMTGAWAWNAPGYHRSYWGMSPAYFQDTYPEVAGDIATIGASNLRQNYLTYNQVLGINNEGTVAPANALGYDAETTNPTPRYFKETTVGNKALNGGNPAAAVASVIYVGKYTLTVNGAAVDANTTFYTYLKGNVPVIKDEKTINEQRPFIYFESNASGNSTVAGGESMLKRFCAQSTILFNEVDGTDGNKVIEELGIEKAASYTKMINCLSVKAIDQSVKDAVNTTGNTAEGSEAKSLKLQANAVSLQITSAEDAQAQGLLIAAGNGYRSIVADNVAETEETTGADGKVVRGTIHISRANAILMQQVGFAYKYTSGMAYFNVPVRHYGWYRSGNLNMKENADGTMPAFNWRLVCVGDFGMVRNHSYDVKINSITGLGSGIANGTDPIVPPASTEDYYITYSVNILKWAVVPTQGVDL